MEPDDELLRAGVRGRAIKVVGENRVHAERCEQRGAFLGGRQAADLAACKNVAGWGQKVTTTAGPGSMGAGGKPADDLLMAAMDAIKDADCQPALLQGISSRERAWIMGCRGESAGGSTCNGAPATRICV